ncbi:MAG: hypothetical protein K2J32_06035 [Ruminococcus sp.]|nr:hypothetical protein [Ruminococcus sp.]
MKYTHYYSPMDEIITNIDANILYNDIIKNFKNYWSSVSTAYAEIHYFEDEESIATLIINVHLDYGIYLRYESNEEKLSVFDKNKLNEIIWIKDLYDFSMGLYLPPELAWKGIKEFLETGTASKEIEWISPDDIPEGGNY